LADKTVGPHSLRNVTPVWHFENRVREQIKITQIAFDELQHWPRPAIHGRDGQLHQRNWGEFWINHNATQSDMILWSPLFIE
jgi:hypothetical protein